MRSPALKITYILATVSATIRVDVDAWRFCRLDAWPLIFDIARDGQVQAPRCALTPLSKSRHRSAIFTR
jgi:hypothetical protein